MYLEMSFKICENVINEQQSGKTGFGQFSQKAIGARIYLNECVVVVFETFGFNEIISRSLLFSFEASFVLSVFVCSESYFQSEQFAETRRGGQFRSVVTIKDRLNRLTW